MPKSKVNPVHAAQIAYAAQPEMRCPLPDDRAAVPTGSNAERSMPDARRTIDEGAEGQQEPKWIDM